MSMSSHANYVCIVHSREAGRPAGVGVHINMNIHVFQFVNCVIVDDEHPCLVYYACS